ncbi:MAG: NAD(P)H-dependent glycerol-3-phosphate dehydrogenase [Bacteroidetes bacterium QS_1_63_11]|nr:MAG: NAD(P)H-dependent glycerol-3-phosphate dehydrogenase [Bacteroidetes bacterium QS_1_63_11]
MPASITLFGAGSWGTALAAHLANQDRDVTLWARRKEAVAQMRQTYHNPTYLPEVHIPQSVHLTSDLQVAAEATSLWAIAVPAQNLRSIAARLTPHVRRGITVVSLAKGIENDTLQTMSQVLDEELSGISTQKIGVLYGPSHAEEVARSHPTTVVAAAPTEPRAEWIQDAFMTERLRVYVNTDVRGVEIGGSAKNVLAIAAGISDGVGYGENAKAALVTRGLAEIRRLGIAMGASPKTFAGLTGIGDVVVTCMSTHSRNRYLGEQIGRGESLDDIRSDMDMVAEGVRTTQSVRNLAHKHEVEMPITEAVHAILFEGERPQEMVDELMTRSAKRELWIGEEGQKQLT